MSNTTLFVGPFGVDVVMPCRVRVASVGPVVAASKMCRRSLSLLELAAFTFFIIERVGIVRERCRTVQRKRARRLSRVGSRLQRCGLSNI